MSGIAFVVSSRWIARVCGCTVVIGLVAVATAQTDATPHAPEATQNEPQLPKLSGDITRAEIEAHVRALASDEMQGRATGTRGGELAARYLARVLAATGVAPGGDDGTFLQAVVLRRTRAKAEPVLSFTTFSGESIPAVYGRDYTAALEPAKFEKLALRIVREAADLAHETPSSTALFIDASQSKREDWLKKGGHPRGSGLSLYLQSGSSMAGEPAHASGDASSLLRTYGTTGNVPWLKMRGPLLKRLREGELASVSFTFDVDVELTTAHNVIGWIHGAGAPGHAELADEALVLSAHYDHLGERAPREPQPASGAAPSEAEPDHIYNGADDDASGCAAVLELAGAFADGAKPARSVIFLLVTGEEIGLLGTEEYLDRPLVPLDHTVVNLNFEMIGRPDGMVGGAGAMWLTGHELSNLGPAFVAAGLPVHPDPRPEQNFFERSDNFAFVRRGVVGQSLSSFNMHKDYHGPHDEADRLDYDHMLACTRVAYDAVRLVADGLLQPGWMQSNAPPARGH